MITTHRYKEEDAIQEAISLFDRLGDKKCEFVISQVSGIILGYTSLNQFEILPIFKNILMDEPWEFRYILRVIPIEYCIQTDLIMIRNQVEKLVEKKISPIESYRVTVEKRHTNLRRDEIISTVTKNLDQKVNLDRPEWIIMIQIIGKFTGISVLRQDQIFNSILEKRNIGLRSQ